jgi:kinesin family protein C2/C3
MSKHSNHRKSLKGLGPGKEEQKLFEQRLCDENYGVAVRKIHSNGKSQLRYVKCISMDPKQLKSKKLNMSHSLPAHVESPSFKTSPTSPLQHNKQMMALTWGHKKTVPLLQFTQVRKGKTTERTKRNPNPSGKLLSLITNDRRHGSLDIEAPTQLDRDKFAKAFSVFLGVDLVEDFVGQEVHASSSSSAPVTTAMEKNRLGPNDKRSSNSVASNRHTTTMQPISDDVSLESSNASNYSSVYSNVTPRGQYNHVRANGSLLPSLHSSPSSTHESKMESKSQNELHSDLMMPQSSLEGNSNHDASAVSANPLKPRPAQTTTEIHSQNNEKEDNKKESVEDDLSAVSSLTQGFDQEIVEELHQEINELRAELEASRAEAARAVKVAEQAIQSAEAHSSNDWNSTVTHKAAEAAAQAQKRSAEAIAKQRIAEEKLAEERKSATFWRNQAQKVEDEVGALKTRLTVAQVQRTAVTEELDRERRKAASYIQTMKKDYSSSEALQRELLASTAEQNRLLEIELDGTRQDYIAKDEELKSLQENILELKNELALAEKSSKKSKLFCKPKMMRGESLLLESDRNSTASISSPINAKFESIHLEELLKIQAESHALKKQFEILKRTTVAELSSLPGEAQEWSNLASRAMNEVQNEVNTLKNQLALEMANRRKLLHEVQDLRGVVRVYCRPKPLPISTENQSPTSIVSVPSNDVLLLHKTSDDGEDIHMCFEFDRMFAPHASQSEVYMEMEELVLGALDGFNSCLIAYGSSESGKTHTLIGDYNVTLDDDEDAFPTVEILQTGIHLMAAQQLFQVSFERSDRYEDSFSLSILEVHDEKLYDLLAHSDFAQNCGVVKGLDGKGQKLKKKSNEDDSAIERQQTTALEIRTNHDGDTIVQGLLSVPVKSYDEVLKIWQESLIRRATRAKELGIDFSAYESNSHLIATIEVISTNITNGIGTVGKVQFVDLAGSDVIQRKSSISTKSKSTGMDDILAPIGNNNEWKFLNKSIATFSDVVNARVTFSRDTPYGNSTITHVLRDALEADTKTLLLACVSSDPNDLQETANTLRFASKMRQMVIGKATKRHITIA